jgi:hypothetical protein
VGCSSTWVGAVCVWVTGHELGNTQAALCLIVTCRFPQVIAQLALSFDPEQRPTFSLITSELGPVYEKLRSDHADARRKVRPLSDCLGKALDATYLTSTPFCF